MSRIILLDSGPLGLITNPIASEENRECNAWIQGVSVFERASHLPTAECCEPIWQAACGAIAK
jgi:hypothetical protein